jgi:hypothetical protein
MTGIRTFVDPGRACPGPGIGPFAIGRFVVIAVLLLSAACADEWHPGKTGPNCLPPPTPPPDNGPPTPERLFAPNRMELLLRNDGSRGMANAVVSFDDGPIVFDFGLWVGARVNGRVRVSATSYNAPEFRPLPRGPDSVALAYILVPGDGPGEADYDAWPVEAGAPSDDERNPRRIGTATGWIALDDSDPSSHTVLHSDPLQAEVRETVWAETALDSVLFVRFQVTNVSSATWEDLRLGIWCDADVGMAANDLVGSDPARQLGYTYTAAAPETIWGAWQPAVGFTFLETPEDAGMTAFPQLLKGWGEPNTAPEAYNLLHGLDKLGAGFVDPTTQEVTVLAVSGDPVSGTGWYETYPMDRRLLMSTGPFVAQPGRTLTLTVALVAARARRAHENVTALRAAVDAVRANPASWSVSSP